MPDTHVLAERPGQDQVVRYDAIAIGAGISGMFMLYRLRELGMTARVFEAGTNLGGTWYWNRYPGARFDSESWTYGYSFSKELMQEWDWKEHFSPQPDTLEYLNHVADKFDLRRDMQFGSTVTAAHWNDAADQWTVTLESGQQAKSRFLCTAIGILSAYTLPAIPGRDQLPRPRVSPGALAAHAGGLHWQTRRHYRHRGDRHSGHPRDRQAGEAAHRLPAAPELGRTAAQRQDQQRDGEIKSRYDEIYAHCATTAMWFIHQADSRKTMEVLPEEREAFWEKVYGEPGFGIWLGNFRDIGIDEKANAAISDFIAQKIRQRVKDPKVAEKLIPKDHGFGTRRVPLESGYFEAYNRDNVTLVDTLKDEPIECITPKGIRTMKQEYEFDVLIYATGFDGVTGAFDRIDIRGKNGVRLKDAWAESPRTYLGMLAEGFPNMLMVLGPHTARGNIPQAIEHSVQFQTGMLRFMQEHNYTHVETRPEQVDEWTQTVIKAAETIALLEGRFLADRREPQRRGPNRAPGPGL